MTCGRSTLTQLSGFICYSCQVRLLSSGNCHEPIQIYNYKFSLGTHIHIIYSKLVFAGSCYCSYRMGVKQAVCLGEICVKCDKYSLETFYSLGYGSTAGYRLYYRCFTY